jgi:hypothetical protein
MIERFPDRAIRLPEIIRLFQEKGCTRLLVKEMAWNHDYKRQVYWATDLSFFNLIPGRMDYEPPRPDYIPVSRKKKAKDETIIYEHLDFSWMDSTGALEKAPSAKLIYYPQYPEIRLSGFKQGVKSIPARFVKEKSGEVYANRLLFLGIRDEQVLALLAVGQDDLRDDLRALPEYSVDLGYNTVPLHVGPSIAPIGIIQESLLDEIRSAGEMTSLLSQDIANLNVLLPALRSVADKGAIPSCRLLANGERVTYSARNGGGYTLEAELGVTPNGDNAPDFAGWEVKQHARGSSPITLMTPEPDRGIYREDVRRFMERYGHTDRKNSERRNFGGIYRAGMVNRGLMLELRGCEPGGTRFDLDGFLQLTDVATGECAAGWSFKKLIEVWSRKHIAAVYLTSVADDSGPVRSYQYSPVVHLGLGTDFHFLLNAIGDGLVYLDPALKCEAWEGRGPIKRRNQFRIKPANLPRLYHCWRETDLGSL